MADWFKFYENAIDEPCLASAIQDLPEVLGVLLLLRSEHCKHKSATLTWSADEFMIRGLARKINCPLPKFTQALSLLMRIKYYEIKDGQLTDLMWDGLQSEYCQRKTRLQNQADGKNHKQSPKSVGTLSEQSPKTVHQEERRGEEIRKEESNNLNAGASVPIEKSVQKNQRNQKDTEEPPTAEKPPPPQVPQRGRKPKDLAECLAMAQRIGMIEQDARDWYRDCEACDWKRGDFTPFDHWPRQMTIHRDKLAERRAMSRGNGAPGAMSGAQLILKQNELKRVEEKITKIRTSVDGHRDLDEKDRKELKELKARRSELMTALDLKV